MKSLLIPVDFSAHAVQAVSYAAGIAADLGYALHLLHVTPIPIPTATSPLYGGSVPIFGVEPLVRDIQKEAAEQMQSLINDMQPTLEQEGYTGPIYHTIVEGEAVEEIANWVEVHQPVGMILGVTPRSTLYRLFIGSTAGKLLHRVKAPILAVPIGTQYLGIEKAIFASNFDPEDQVLWHKMNAFLDNRCKSWHVVHMVTDLEERYFHDKESEIAQRLHTKWVQAEMKGEVQISVFTEGDLLPEIEKYARSKRAGLIAFVSHRKTLLTRMIEPSVSSAALFHLHQPMLFLHGGAE